MTLGLITNCYNPKFFKNAHEFNPERWLDKE